MNFKSDHTYNNPGFTSRQVPSQKNKEYLSNDEFTGPKAGLEAGNLFKMQTAFQ